MLKWPLTLHVIHVQVYWDTELFKSLELEDSLEMAGHLAMTLGRDCIIILQVCQDIEFFELVELYLEGAGYSPESLGKEMEWLLFWSPGVELFDSVECTQEMVLKWQDTQLWHLEETVHSHCWLISWCWNVCLCNLTEYLYYRGNFMIVIENGLKETNNIYHIMILNGRFMSMIWKCTCHTGDNPND